LKEFKGILLIGEKSIFNELYRIVAIAAQANEILRVMYQNVSNVQLLNDKMRDVRTLEKKSDEIAFNLNEDITSGAVSPNIIDDLINSVRSADNIVDVIFYLSRELARMSKVDTSNFKLQQLNEWAQIYGKLLQLADQALIRLQTMLSTSQVSSILQLRKEIEAIEEEGDDIKDSAFDKLYHFAPELHFLQFFHYSEMLHKCDDLLDNSEDLADIVVSIITSILK
jgi:hypothetical protein